MTRKKRQRKKADYSNTVIYRFYSKNPDIEDDYIGHATDFVKRQTNHKSSCNNNSEKNKEYNYEVYKYIRENGGFDNWQFEILVYADLKDKDEAEKLEKHYIKIFKPTLNDNDVAVTPEEKAEYYREYLKKRREDPEYRKKEAETTKKWREDNPESWAATLAASVAKRLESYTCICGCSTSKTNEARHHDSIKHKAFLKNNPLVN